MHQDVQLFRPPTSIMAGRCDYLMKHVGLVPTGVDASASDPSQSRALTVAPSDWSIVISRENDQGPSQCHRARSRKNSRPRHRLKSAMPRQNAHYQGWELLRSSPLCEVFNRIEQGGCLRGAVVEAQDDSPHPKYAVFLLSSWRKEYTVLGFNSREKPRLFRGLDRIILLVRGDYGFKGTVAVRLASEGPLRSHSWRITHGADFARPAGS